MNHPEFYNYKIILAYEGTCYHGWQVQDNGLSIQQVIQDKLEIFLRHPVQLIGSGRTDAGVHAHNQVANFKSSIKIEPRRFLGSANALLPPDIRIKEIHQVPPDFHAQHSAIAKTYHYHLHLDLIQDPFKRLYSLHVKEKIDLQLLKDAAAYLVGTHDFTSFANEAHRGTAAHDPIRTLKRLDVIPQEGGVRLEFEADGFLYKMVRNIVGLLLDIARGNREIKEIPEIFSAKNRSKAGASAPPHGLFLVRVDY